MNHNYQNINLPLTQQGIGLVEVLVALLLLAVAALGYSALQAQSLQTTDESLTRTQAITILRSAAEKIRANAINSAYDVSSKDPAKKDDTPAKILAEYKTGLATTELEKLDKSKCLNTDDNGCSPSEMAKKDVLEIKQSAQSIGIKIGATTCPGTTKTGAGQTLCLIAAWNDTTPTVGEGAPHCIKDTGSYNTRSDCVYMETY